MRAYAQRPIRFRQLLEHAGWRIKDYAISAGAASGLDAMLDVALPAWPEFAEGRARLLRALPVPASAPGRDGVGFLVEHRGAGADYMVLGWWDRENELPTRIAVRDQRAGAEWREARASESFCVWDLQVMAFERDAYVATVLGGTSGADSVDAYLSARLELAGAQ